MIKTLNIILVTLLIISFTFTSHAAEVRYLDYDFKEEIVQMPKTDMFVLCNNCPKTELIPYRDPEDIPLTINMKDIPKPVVSVMVSDGKEIVSMEKGQSIKQEQTDVVIPFKVYFDFNSFKLKDIEKEKLLDWSKTKKGLEVEVMGYACPIGSEDYNKVLSAKRAGAVSELLKKQGVIILKMKGVGETTEFAEKEKEYHLNRVVEIIPIKKGGETK